MLKRSNDVLEAHTFSLTSLASSLPSLPPLTRPANPPTAGAGSLTERRAGTEPTSPEQPHLIKPDPPRLAGDEVPRGTPSLPQIP